MTVASQVKQCFYSLKGAQENLESLALIAKDQQASQELIEAVQNLRTVTNDLNKRIGKMEWEEPQYKGF